MTDGQPQDVLDRAPANVAGTRPALVPWFGIPYEPLVWFCVAGFVVGQWVHGLRGIVWGLGAFVALWLPSFILTKRDYNAIRIFRIYIRTNLTCRDRSLFHGASVAAFPIKRPKRGRGTRRAV